MAKSEHGLEQTQLQQLYELVKQALDGAGELERVAKKSRRKAPQVFARQLCYMLSGALLELDMELAPLEGRVG